MKTIIEYKVEVRNMNGQDNRVNYFNTFNEAYRFYNQKCDQYNLDNAAYSDAEMNLDAGGLGYDYRVELILCE